MPQPGRFAVPAAPAPTRGKSAFATVVLAVVSLGWLLGGIACLVLRTRDPQPGPLVAPAGVVLVASALAQWRLIFAAWRAGGLTLARLPFAQWRYWRALAIGAVVAYLAALAVGPVPHIGWAWIAAVGGWQTLLLVPLCAAPKTIEDWRQRTQGHTARSLAWLVYASVVLLVVAELGLRAQRIVVDARGFARAAAPESAGAASGAAPPGVRLARLKGARFRVAIVANGAACSRESDGYLARIEQALPGVQIVPLACSVTGPAGGTRELAAQVRRCDPDLLLTVLPVCEDLSREPVECGCFDWRQFELARLLIGRRSDEPPRAAPRADDFESFLRGFGPQLAACRTPIDDAMRGRWESIFAALDELVADCRAAGVPMALVIVPAEFQVNRALCDTLLRRHGLPAEAFDAELPQRRLAGFAEPRDLPLIDLLPHLRLCRQSVYRRHATVLSEEGNSAAASAIGGWLQSRYGGQLAAQLSAKP